MRFLLDENVGKKVAEQLQLLGHVVLRIKEISPGTDDYRVLKLSVSKHAILITSDKDFGELIFKEKQSHCGVIFLRLNNETSSSKLKAIKLALECKKIKNKFMIVTEKDNKYSLRHHK